MALAIAASVKHFSPYIIQSHKPVCVLTDSKPCVEAAEKTVQRRVFCKPKGSHISLNGKPFPGIHTSPGRQQKRPIMHGGALPNLRIHTQPTRCHCPPCGGPGCIIY